MNVEKPGDLYYLDSQSFTQTYTKPLFASVFQVSELGVKPLAKPSLDQPDATTSPAPYPSAFHHRCPFAPRQLLHHAGPPVPHHATSNDLFCPSPGATRTPLTDTI